MRHMRIKAFVGLVACVGLIAGCSLDEPATPTANMNQLTERYGALGNSLTAGFMGGALFNDGQMAGYPYLISRQMGIEKFEMPLVDQPGIGAPNSLGIPQGMFYVDEFGVITTDNVLDPVGLLLNSLHPVGYDNLGIPGATTFDLANATSAATSQSGGNLFFDLILRNSALPPFNTTQLDQMMALAPDYLSLWVGANDVLGGAAGGNPVAGVNITPGSVWPTLFTPILDAIEMIPGVHVVLGNIPSIPSAPFFTTIPVVADVPGIGSFRWAMDEDTDDDPVIFVLITAPVADPAEQPNYIAELGGTKSLGGQYTLTQSEVDLLDATVDAINSTIASEAAARGWGLADIHALMSSLPNDMSDPATFGRLNSVFPWGAAGQNVFSAFSLDAIHPSEKGYASVANFFIDAFNDTYEMSIPAVDEGAVTNVIGFANSPGFVPPRGRQASAPLYSAEGRDALIGLVELLGADQ